MHEVWKYVIFFVAPIVWKNQWHYIDLAACQHEPTRENNEKYFVLWYVVRRTIYILCSRHNNAYNSNAVICALHASNTLTHSLAHLDPFCILHNVVFIGFIVAPTDRPTLHRTHTLTHTVIATITKMNGTADERAMNRTTSVLRVSPENGFHTKPKR